MMWEKGSKSAHETRMWPCLLILLALLHPPAWAFDPDDPPDTRIPLARFLTFGGTAALRHEQTRNGDPNAAQVDDISHLQTELALAFSFDPAPRFQAFLDTELAWRWDRAEGAENLRDVHLEVMEAFVLFKTGLDGQVYIQIGRQPFEDDRQWLLGEALDAVRVSYRWPQSWLELSVSRLDLLKRDRLGDVPTAQTNNYLLFGNTTLGEEDEAIEIAAYVLAQHDASDAKERPIFLGLHADGALWKGAASWMEIAQVRGQDGPQRVRGMGFDVGATYTFERAGAPSLSLGYAFGTGDDDPDDGLDRRFRQSGLQDNEGEFNGVQSFKYYGVLFDPELQNLAILTYGVGLHPTERSSVDLVAHHYRQHRASETLPESGLDVEPDGHSRKLGGEVDLIAGFEGARHLAWGVALGYFIPCCAFPAGEDRHFFVSAEVQYSF